MNALDSLGRRLRRLPSIGVDATMGAGLFLVGSFELLQSINPGLPSHRPAGLLLLLVATLGVAIRRKAPWVAFAGPLLAAVVSLVGHIPYAIGNSAFLCELVILYTVAERSGAGPSLLALAAALVTDGLVVRTVYQVSVPLDIQTDVPAIMLAWFAGYAQHRRQITANALERQAAELEEERERLSRAAVANERSRVARELHALVVRGVERMRRETRAARAQLAADGDRVRELLDAIETTGRTTLVEMRRLVSLLRTDDTRDPVSVADADEPAPTTSRNPRHLAKLIALKRWVAAPLVADALVVAVMAGLAAAEPFSGTGFFQSRWIDSVLIALGTSALLLRRPAPLITLVVVTTTVFVWNAILRVGDPNAGDRAMLIAVFSVAEFRGLRWALGAIGAQIAAYAPLLRLPGACDLACQVTWTPFFVFAVVAGLAVREARRLNEQLRSQSEMLRTTRAQRVTLAVAQERTRVARDLHDVVAHGVTLMVVQGGAAAALAASDPRRADQALRAVEAAGEQALRELHFLEESLGWDAMGKEVPLPEIEPERIGALVAEAAATGMEVRVVIDGDPGPLDPGLAISLYRVIQEALTNVRRHAPGAEVRVQISYRLDGVEVEVNNTGASEHPKEPVPGAGQGLIGIVERAALFGGKAEAGPTPEGGFRVWARLAPGRVTV